jgi:hypothetical protein
VGRQQGLTEDQILDLNAYADSLDGVRAALGRDIDFSIQADREAIGNALIERARTTGGCDISNKVKGC